MPINPIQLSGPWDDGYALDLHTLSSEFIGDNEYGHPMFDTTYTEVGDLLRLFKYRNDHETLYKIIELAKPFLHSWRKLETVDFVLPVPPSRERKYQPAQEIATEIAKFLGAKYSDQILIKANKIESKGLSAEEKKKIHGAIAMKKTAKKSHNILLVDDLYESGTTLGECVRALRGDPNILEIYVLTMTKTRKG